MPYELNLEDGSSYAYLLLWNMSPIKLTTFINTWARNMNLRDSQLLKKQWHLLLHFLPILQKPKGFVVSTMTQGWCEKWESFLVGVWIPGPLRDKMYVWIYVWQGGTKRCSAVATLHENLNFGRKSWPPTYAVLLRNCLCRELRT